MSISHIHGIALAGVSHIDGIAKASLSAINGQSLASSNGLLTNLISYWKMDEASGNAVDAHGSNTLTDNNTVGSTTGKINNARSFPVSDPVKSFSITDNASVSVADIDFTFAGWIRFTSLPGGGFYRTFFAKRNGSNGEYDLALNGSTNKLDFTIYKTAGFADASVVSTTGTISIDTWYFVVAWHDATANTVNIQVNNGTPDSAAATNGGVYDGTGSFYIGADNFGNPHDGLIDEVGFWKGTLNSTQRGLLYGSGSGLAYSSFS